MRFTSISAGGSHTCGLTNQGEAYCWGDDSSGQRGDGFLITAGRQSSGSVFLQPDASSNENLESTPQLVLGDLVFKQISAGLEHTCGVTIEEEAFCWGEGANGRLGNGSTINRGNPTLVTSDDGLRFTSISAGSEHTCAVTDDQELYCWGSGANFRLGSDSALNVTQDDRLTPGLVSTEFNNLLFLFRWN